MLPVPEINNIYYNYDTEITGNPLREYRGIKIICETINNSSDSVRLRWTFEEAWKFRVDWPALVIPFLNDSLIDHIETTPKNEFCWKQSSSNEILLASANAGKQVSTEELHFITPALSDRIGLQYAINLKQYSMSVEEYNFWKKIKETTEEDADIFGKQPDNSRGNLSNVNNPGEIVLGYFQVSAVSSKVLHISADDLEQSQLDYAIKQTCTLVPLQSILPDELRRNGTEAEWWTYAKGQGYEISMYSQTAGDYMITYPDCIDCRITGSAEAPYFWSD